MPRSATNSFADALHRIMQEIASAKMTPDADQEFLSMVEGSIIERMQNPALGPVGVSAAGAQPGFSAAQMGGEAGAPGGMPAEEEAIPTIPTSQAPTRLPSGGAAPGGEVEELRRVMAGS